MGAKVSKTGDPSSQHNSGKPTGAHSPLPEDVTPYQGPKLELLVVSVPVQMRSHFVSGMNAGAQAVTSNVDAYYSMISQYLGQGYTLVTFYRVPGVSQMSGFGAATVPFEAVFSKPVTNYCATSFVPNRLLIDKATMHIQHAHGGLLTMNTAQGTVADTSDIMNKIVHHSSQGARLICVEINGAVTTQGMSAAMSGISSGIGVDVLFENPPQPGPAQYVYQVINVPIGIHVQMGFNPKPTVTCDWFGILASYLNQGWKLVEIFLDQSQQRAGGFSTSGSMNSVWFFEKEAHKLQDPTPVYEGTVVEYYHKISLGFTGVKLKTDWYPVINEMGQRGWELACIQETPEVIRHGMMKFEMKLMMFFQRPIINIGSTMPYPAGAAHPPGTAPPPPYQSEAPAMHPPPAMSVPPTQAPPPPPDNEGKAPL